MVLPNVEFLADFFFLRTLNISSHCFLTSMVSDEKLTVNVIENPVYVTRHFSIAAFRILSVFVFLDFDCNVFLCGSL